MRKMTICLICILSIIYLYYIPSQANDNENTTELPTAGFNEFISDVDVNLIPPTIIDYTIINHNGFKSYMSYKAIKNTSSSQYKLQELCYTDENGFRKIHDRYCVAIGTAFNATIGQYFDVQLENGEIIKCVVADIKADKDTDNSHIFTSQGCCLEFLVETSCLIDTVKNSGNCSSLYESWDSSCIKFSIYNLTILEKGE